MRPTLSFERDEEFSLKDAIEHDKMLRAAGYEEDPELVGKPTSACKTDESMPENHQVDFLNYNAPFFTVLDQVLEAAAKHLQSGKSMVAGGAVRDTLLGRPVKDIDLFIDEAYAEEIHDFVTAIGGSLKDRTSSLKAKETYGGSFDVFTITDDNKIAKGYEIQLIHVENLEDHLQEFGVGLSMVSYNKNGLYIDKRFLQDFNGRKLTVYPSKTTSASRLATYYSKVNDKYPSFSLDLSPIQEEKVSYRIVPMAKEVQPEVQCDVKVYQTSPPPSVKALSILDKIRARAAATKS